MAYCRWSSDNMECDLYAYEHVDGTWRIHVAVNRYQEAIPPHPLGLGLTGEEYQRAYEVRQAVLENARLVSLGLAHDGAAFVEPSLTAFRDRLLALRAAGYRFPNYVLDVIDQEMNALEGEAT